MGCEIAHGAISPIIHQRPSVVFFEHIGVVKAATRQQFDSGHPEGLEVWNLLDQT